MIWQAVHAGFDYFQREAGYTRTGSHGTRVHGRETGQWHEADLAVAHWLQHTSRDGDMQLHVHSQIAHVARTTTDGKWRAPDSLGYNEHIGAVAAIVSQHLEEALTRRFGLEWTARDDGHGFEIKGISGQMMRLFSSRRESITADLRARAARFEERYGRAPSQRELAHLAQASNFKTRNPKHGALDLAQAHAGWADKLARTLGVPLASIAPSVWHEAGRATARGTTSPGPALTEADLTRAAQKAVALAQQEKSAWTRADVIKHLGRVLPRTGMNPAASAALLEDLTNRVLRLPVRSGGLPGGARAARGSDEHAARGRPQHLSAARRRTVRDARAPRHGGAHARASPRGHRAEAGARAGRARARRRPGASRKRTHRRRARHTRAADGGRAARGPGRRRARGTRRRPGRIGDQRPGRIRQDPCPGRGRPHLGRSRAGPGNRRHPVPVGPQHPGRRGPSVLQRRSVPRPPARPPRRPRPGPHRPGHPSRRRRSLDAVRPGPGRPDRLREGPRSQDHPGRRRQPAAGRGERRRHVPARRRARLRPAGRTRPIPQPVGTASQPAATGRRHQCAGHLRPARPHPRRRPGSDDGHRRSCLHRPVHGWHRHAPHGRRPRAAARAESPHPQRPHRLRHRQRRTRCPHRRRHPGQSWRPDHLHPQRLRHRGRRTRPHTG